MQNGIVIKSSRAGMTVLLDPNLPFEELLVAIAKKFKDSARFWGAVQMTLTLEGRRLTPEEEMAVVNTITENSQIDVLCLLDTDAQRIERCEKALNEKLMELSAQTGQFYRGTLRSGQKIEVDGSIVILGDINPGAQIVAGGNVVVLGCLKGTVHAGYPEDNSAFVAALMMEPMQIQIGSYIARSPDQRVKNTKKNAKKKNRQELLAKLAFVENDSIFIETITRSLISEISIS